MQRGEEKLGQGKKCLAETPEHQQLPRILSLGEEEGEEVDKEDGDDGRPKSCVIAPPLTTSKRIVMPG